LPPGKLDLQQTTVMNQQASGKTQKLWVIPPRTVLIEGAEALDQHGTPA
jgi:hypothetical protein